MAISSATRCGPAPAHLFHNSFAYSDFQPQLDAVPQGACPNRLAKLYDQKCKNLTNVARQVFIKQTTQFLHNTSTNTRTDLPPVRAVHRLRRPRQRQTQ